jgi:hypothetical protein
MFREMVTYFNSSIACAPQPWMTQTLDKSMSSYKSRKDKQACLSIIFNISRKHKPLGTEFKTMCDTDNGVMMWAEVQEGKTTTRQKTFSRELGSACATSVRAMELTAIQPGTALLDDS